MDDFNRQKIMYADISNALNFCLVEEEMFCNNTIYFMTSDHIDLCEILYYLNSKVINWYYKCLTVQLGESAIRLFSIYVLKLPIPLSLNKNIYNTYGLSLEEIEFIESL